VRRRLPPSREPRDQHARLRHDQRRQRELPGSGPTAVALTTWIEKGARPEPQPMASQATTSAPIGVRAMNSRVGNVTGQTVPNERLPHPGVGAAGPGRRRESSTENGVEFGRRKWRQRTRSIGIFQALICQCAGDPGTSFGEGDETRTELSIVARSLWRCGRAASCTRGAIASGPTKTRWSGKLRPLTGAAVDRDSWLAPADRENALSVGLPFGSIGSTGFGGETRAWAVIGMLCRTDRRTTTIGGTLGLVGGGG
jgi:hypothetical protein